MKALLYKVENNWVLEYLWPHNNRLSKSFRTTREAKAFARQCRVSVLRVPDCDS